MERIKSVSPDKEDKTGKISYYFDPSKKSILKQISKNISSLIKEEKFNCLGIEEKYAELFLSFFKKEVIQEVNESLKANWDDIKKIDEVDNDPNSEEKKIKKNLVQPLEYIKDLLSSFTKLPRFVASKHVYAVKQQNDGEEFKEGDTFTLKEFTFATVTPPVINKKASTVNYQIFEIYGDFLAYDVSIFTKTELIDDDSVITLKDAYIMLYPGLGYTVREVRTDESNTCVKRLYVECHCDPSILTLNQDARIDGSPKRIFSGAFSHFNSLPKDFSKSLNDAVLEVFGDNETSKELIKKMYSKSFKEDDLKLLRTLGLSKENFLTFYLLGLYIEIEPQGKKVPKIRVIDYINDAIASKSRKLDSMKWLILHILCSMRRVPRYINNESIYLILEKSKLNNADTLPGIYIGYDKKTWKEIVSKNIDQTTINNYKFYEIVGGFEYLRAYYIYPFIYGSNYEGSK